MGSRETILEILSKHSEKGVSMPKEVESRELFKDYPPEGVEESLKAFSDRLALLSGECYPVANKLEAAKKILEIVNATKYTKIAVDRSEFVVDVVSQLSELLRKIGNNLPISLEEAPGTGFASYEVSITQADKLIARTGSVVIRNTTCGGRRLSVLPEFHIVLAKTSQIIPTHTAWLKMVKADPASSYAAVITGPSRTSDIEKILVLGAHGPKRLAVVVVRG